MNSNPSLGEEIEILNGAYKFTSAGVITSLHKRNPGKIISKRIDRAGYYTVRLSKNGITTTFLLHRLVAQIFIPNPENKPYVNHINGNKLDYRICNLEWSTLSENMHHAFSTGLCKAPEINSKQVIDRATGEIFKSVMQAAKAKGIAYSTCKNYLRGRRKNKTTLMCKPPVNPCRQVFMASILVPRVPAWPLALNS